MEFDFTMWLSVYDPEDLKAAAMQHVDAKDSTSADFENSDGSVDISACLTMLLDPGSLPGCSIQSSGAVQAS